MLRFLREGLLAKPTPGGHGLAENKDFWAGHHQTLANRQMLPTEETVQGYSFYSEAGKATTGQNGSGFFQLTMNGIFPRWIILLTQDIWPIPTTPLGAL